jgi:hypothetical protein
MEARVLLKRVRRSLASASAVAIRMISWKATSSANISNKRAESNSYHAEHDAEDKQCRLKFPHLEGDSSRHAHGKDRDTH